MVLATSGMASYDAESVAIRQWAKAAFLGVTEAAAPAPSGLELLRQDHGILRLGRSVLGGPICLADKVYKHGLGTHSVSQIDVHLAEPGGVIEAMVGVDHNADTAGVRGSVEFVVEVGGHEAFRSGVRRGSDPALPVKVDLGQAKEFTLKVLDGGDGEPYDQADWADARVTRNRKTQWIDELPVRATAKLGTATPFSMKLDGKLADGWQRSADRLRRDNGKECHEVSFRHAQSGLVATIDLTFYDGFPAADWTMCLRNDGGSASPMIEELRPLDLRLAPPPGGVTLHRMMGSTTQETDFRPQDDTVENGYSKELAPRAGRSSDGTMPFFNLEWNGGGLLGAIGWSGQWALRVARDQSGEMCLAGGQQTTHLRLEPGEEVRTPRVLLLRWDGDDPLRGNNLFRRLVLAQLAPKVGGKPIVPPIAWNTWFQYNEGNQVTEANQLAAIAKMASVGVEAFWLDAGWFEGGWPNGAGSWIPKKEAFPRGLRPLGDAAHKAGMKFVLWFEPERVTPISAIAKEHPEWVLRAPVPNGTSWENDNGLFDLGNPDARRWLTDTMSKCIEDWGVDVWRCDFNIGPLRYWQRADASDRQGIHEIRYIEGLYAMWDELLRRHPGLTIDNCASGGRRIDLETICRSYPLWRSDTQCCGQPQPVMDQDQTLGLSFYVPTQSAGVWKFDPYSWRSVALAGTNLCMSTNDPSFHEKDAVRAIAETKRLRPLYYGDYYPLFTAFGDERQWSGYQFDRPDMGQGMAVLFRRSQSPYASIQVSLKSIDPKATYEVEMVDSGKRRTMRGTALQKLTIKLDKPASCALIVYTKTGKR